MNVSAKGLMRGKRGLIMGVANSHSIAWGIAQAVAAEGAELAFTFQGEALGKHVKPLAESLGSALTLPCDVEDLASVDALFAEIEKHWGTLDFVVHAIGFSDKNELMTMMASTIKSSFSCGLKDNFSVIIFFTNKAEVVTLARISAERAEPG